MKRTAIMLLIFPLIIGLILLFVCQVVTATILNISSTTSAASHQKSQFPNINEKASSLSSSFTIAAYIVGLVALFGTLLSLYFHFRSGSRVKKKVEERFWAIDVVQRRFFSYSFMSFEGAILCIL